MFSRLPKKHKEKYKKKRSWDEDVLLFACKIVGSATLVFLIAAGVDIYHIME